MSGSPEEKVEAAPSGPLVCASHPDRVAGWTCTECGQAFCLACVRSVQLDEARQVRLCPICQGVCEPAQLEPAREVEGGFAQGLMSALAYPFRGEAFGLLVAAGVLEGLLTLFGRALLFSGALAVLGFGLGLYVLVLLRQILLNAAHGEEAPIRWSTWDWDAIKESALEFFVVCLCCFGPWTVFRIWVRPETGPMWWPGHALLAAGLCYFPMGVLAVVIYDTAAALNPLLVIPSILRTFGPYLLLCGMLGALLGAVFLLETTLSASGGPRLAGAVTGLFSTYTAMVGMRCIGWFYRSQKERLGW